MSDAKCTHGTYYYLDFANQPCALSKCYVCERDALQSRLDRYEKMAAKLEPECFDDYAAYTAKIAEERDAALRRLDALQKEHEALTHDHERLFARDTANLNRLIECQGRLGQYRRAAEAVAANLDMAERHGPVVETMSCTDTDAMRWATLLCEPEAVDDIASLTLRAQKRYPKSMCMLCGESKENRSKCDHVVLCDCDAEDGEAHSDGCSVNSPLVVDAPAPSAPSEGEK